MQVTNEVASDKTSALKESIPQMLAVIHRVARLSCDYVKRRGPAYPRMMEGMDRDLTQVIEDFDRAMAAESLRLANKTSKLSFSQSVNI